MKNKHLNVLHLSIIKSFKKKKNNLQSCDSWNDFIKNKYHLKRPKYTKIPF